MRRPRPGTALWHVETMVFAVALVILLNGFGFGLTWLLSK